MFKNRAVQVKLVKTDENGDIIIPPVETQADIIAFAAESAKYVLKEVTKVIVVYVVIDTARKVILELISDDE